MIREITCGHDCSVIGRVCCCSWLAFLFKDCWFRSAFVSRQVSGCAQTTHWKVSLSWRRTKLGSICSCHLIPPHQERGHSDFVTSMWVPVAPRTGLYVMESLCLAQEILMCSILIKEAWIECLVVWSRSLNPSKPWSTELQKKKRLMTVLSFGSSAVSRKIPIHFTGASISSTVFSGSVQWFANEILQLGRLKNCGSMQNMSYSELSAYEVAG